jgi:hypothetical protein
MRHIKTPTCNDVLRAGDIPDVEDLNVCRSGVFTASYWQPDADDLALLNAGEPIILIVMADTHPPVCVCVEALASAPEMP